MLPDPKNIQHCQKTVSILSINLNPFFFKLPAFEDSISTLFAPIIISCSTMVDRLGDNYSSFTTENNHVYVLHQVEPASLNPLKAPPPRRKAKKISVSL